MLENKINMKNPDLWIPHMLCLQTQLVLQASVYLWISVYICQYTEWDSSKWQQKWSKTVEKQRKKERKKKLCSVRINYLQMEEKELPERKKE